MEDFISVTMVPEFAKYCESAAIGQIDTVKTDYGYHIIEVIKRSEESYPLVSVITKNLRLVTKQKKKSKKTLTN